MRYSGVFKFLEQCAIDGGSTDPEDYGNMFRQTMGVLRLLIMESADLVNGVRLAIAQLKEAGDADEWGGITPEGNEGTCPKCHNYEAEGHEAGCTSPTQSAAYNTLALLVEDFPDEPGPDFQKKAEKLERLAESLIHVVLERLPPAESKIRADFKAITGREPNWPATLGLPERKTRGNPHT